MKPTIRKLGGDWNACYIDDRGITQYVAHAKTKDDLILKLIEKVLGQ